MVDIIQPGLEDILSKAETRGASYSDARYYRYDGETVTVENGVLKSYSSRSLGGVGIRVVAGGGVGYASTSDPGRKGLEDALANAFKAANSIRGEGRAMVKSRVHEAEKRTPVRVDPLDVSPEEKVTVAMDANRAGRVGDEIKNMVTMLGVSRELRMFESTLGADVTVETSMVGLSHESVARVDGVMERCRHGEASCSGFEFIESGDWNALAIDISNLAMEAASSKNPPPGTFPAVVDPLVVGLMLHEALGHASEGDAVMTGDSVLHGRIGDKIASDPVTIVDEGVVANGYYYPFDDEGTRKGKTVIVEDGVLRGYIHDGKSASRLGSRSTGNGRAQDFENIPIVRQTNYYMLPHDQGLDELLEGVDFGVYVRGKGMGGGQVDPGMGTFTFGVGPSKIIRKGELAETVRGVVISGLILDTLKTVDAVGDDLSIRSTFFGGCGKGGQSARVGMGGPHIRVGKMTIGGR